MDLTRRQILQRAAAVTVGGVLTSVTGAGSLAAQAVTGTARRLVGRSTVDLTLLRGEPDATGWRSLSQGPGQRHRVRVDRRVDEPAIGGRAKRGRAGRRRALIAFAQITDVHIIDAQSPLRVEWTDRYDDQPTPSGLFSSAYRPAEILSAQVAEAMVQQINAVERGPVTGRPLALVVQTGDNSDNNQYNEIRWNIDVLDGAEVVPDSGDLTRYEGVADGDPATYDPHYWHPEGTPEGAVDDIPRAEHGFPVVPGLLDAARRPFQATGLSVPWYAAFGNHDGLVQGNFPLSETLDAFGRGGVKVVYPPESVTQLEVIQALLSGKVTALLERLAVGPGARAVTPDEDRRLLTRRQVVEQHFETIGTPQGHGFTEQNLADGTAYYSFDRGKHIRFVVLDTVNPHGGSEGSIDVDQLAWLQEQLASAGRRYVIVCSHHTSTSMDNKRVATGLPPRVVGADLVAALLAEPRVIAWVNGHSHRNRITPHAREGGGGFWEINTAAHIDWPQQSRVIEVADNRDGTLSIFTTILDHAGPLGGAGTEDPLALAALSRELSANDWQERTAEREGTPADRNRELILPKPDLG